MRYFYDGLTGGLCAILMAAGLVPTAGAAEGDLSTDISTATQADAPPDGKIGYVLTYLYWSIYQSEDVETDCPQGFNSGPREQYSAHFPDDGPAPTLEEAQLKFETQTWLPTTEPDGFPFYEPQVNLSYGLNLDGEVTAEDYVSPAGEKGIDNQLYRSLACIEGFRGPTGVEYVFENLAIKSDAYNRLMIQLSGVDSMTNDPEVDVTVYRGRDRLMTDASGDNIVPGGTQVVDMQWGKSLIRHIKGEIVDGTLVTDPIPDLIMPWQNLGVPTYQQIRDMRMQLNLTSTDADGLIAGYADVDTWYKFLIRNDSTHHLSNGYISGISLYKQLRRAADAYPDPETGENTAISASLDAKFVQVHIIEPSDLKEARLDDSR